MDYSEKINKCLQGLTIEQKARLCMGKDAWNTYPIEEENIPNIMMADGPNGLRKQYDEKTASFEEAMPATCFPTSATTACSWDRDLLHEVGRAIGEEAREKNVDMVLGPGINIKRSPLCGRNFEYFSEDPVLAGELGAAIINGTQSTGAGASLKHFAANNREYFRMVSNSVVDERALREIYLEGFEIAVKKGAPYSVMSAYNMLNADYCGEKPMLIEDILRGEWGFDGIVVSDWGAAYNRRCGIVAGMDLEMPYSGAEHTEQLVKAVADGRLDERTLDECVIRMLRFIFKCEENRSRANVCDYKAHHDLARRAAAKSAVLLKNDGNLLPLKKDAKIALIGEFAEKPRYQGAGSSMINPMNLETAIEQFKNYGINYTYAKGFFIQSDQTDEQLAAEAMKAAQAADIAVIMAGLPPGYEMEGVDRTHLDIPQNQNDLIARIAQIKPTVVVLSCGAPILMPWADQVSGILHCYLGGEAGASALAELLTGIANPSGKLAESYPLALKDTPCYHFFDDDRHNVEYRESIYVGYRYYEAANKKVRFPFGFGLSYTRFDYSNLRVSKSEIGRGDEISVRADIRNIGDRDGEEIVQCYVQEKSSPFKKLRAFEKISLKPNECKTVTFTLRERDFSFYQDGWRLQSDSVVSVGSSSDCLPLSAEIAVTGGKPSPVYPLSTNGHWDSVTFYNQFERIPIVSLKSRPFTLNATLTDLDTVAIGRVIHRFARSYVQKNINPGNYLTQDIIMNMLEENPIRALVSMSGGLFTFHMARAVLLLVNGQFIAGIAALFSAIRGMKKAQKEEEKRTELGL